MTGDQQNVGCIATINLAILFLIVIKYIPLRNCHRSWIKEFIIAVLRHYWQHRATSLAIDSSRFFYYYCWNGPGFFDRVFVQIKHQFGSYQKQYQR